MTTDGFRTAFLQPEKLQGDIRGRIIIATDIKAVRAEFGIKAPMVTHNVSYMVSCAALLPDLFTHVRCFGHTLQLPIRGAFNEINTITRTISAAKQIVSHFQRSVSTELHIRQKQMGIAETVQQDETQHMTCLNIC